MLFSNFEYFNLKLYYYTKSTEYGSASNHFATKQMQVDENYLKDDRCVKPNLKPNLPLIS